MEIEEKRKKKIVKPKEEKPPIELFVEMFHQTRIHYIELYQITSNPEYLSYLTRRFRFLADLKDQQCKITEIQAHLEEHQKSWDVEKELYHLKILRIAEYRLKNLLENPILENTLFEEWTLRKNTLQAHIHHLLQDIFAKWKFQIPIYLLQKENIDEVMIELQDRGWIS